MKARIKDILRSKGITKFLGNKRLSDWALRESTVVFLYHEVTNNPSPFYRGYDLNVCPEIFERQVEIIKRTFKVISARDLISGDYETPAALITFDDGARGYFENAIPILAKHKCPSVIFLNMEPIDGEIFWSGLVNYLCEFDKNFVPDVMRGLRSELSDPHFLFVRPEHAEAYLTKNNIKEEVYSKAREFYGPFGTREHLAKCNELVSFGNHLINHYNCGVCTGREISEHFERNQREIDAYPNATRLFSYPFGQKGTCYNDETHAIVRQAGAQAIFTANPHSFRAKNQIYHRYPMTERIVNEEEFRALLFYKRIQQIIHNES